MQSLTDDLFHIRDLAVKDGQHSAAVAALTLIAKMHGLLIDQKQVDIVHHKPAESQSIKDFELSEDEWLRLYKPEGERP